MAKLNGVKTVEATNGEITKVAYDGAEYGAIERGGDAKPGDIIRINANDIIDGTKGAFYVVGENGRYSDNDGDLRNPNFPGLRNSYDVFRKIEEANAMTTFKKGDVVVTVDKVGRAVSGQGLVGKGAVGKVKAVEGDKLTVKFGKKQPLLGAATSTRKNFVLRTSEIRLATADEAASIAKKKADEITFEGAKYRKVDRKAQAGDVVVFRNPENDERWITLGKPYEAVTGDDSELEFEDNDGDRLYLYLNERRSTNNTDVYEKVEAKYVPQEGDIVVVTDASASNHSVGDIGKITEIVCGDCFRVTVPGAENSSNVLLPKRFRKATPAEVEAYEKAVHKASFSVGDYVKIVKSFIGIEGEIVKITDAGAFPTPKGIVDFIIEDVPNKREGIYGVFAEQIVKATEQEVADANKPKLKAGDFVKFTDSHLMSAVTLGKIYELKDYSNGTLYVDTPSGRCKVTNSRRMFGAPVIASADDAKWAKLNRKVGEFRKGDIIKIVGNGSKGAYQPHYAEIGDVLVVTEMSSIYENRPRTSKGAILPEYAELVAPVESTLK